MLTAEKIVKVLAEAKEPLSRDEIFELAGLSNSDMNLHAFNLMRDHGKFEQDGKGRGTKYRLAVVKQPKVEKDIPDWKEQITTFALAKGGVFAFLDLDIPEAFGHHLRANLNEMITNGTVVPMGSKRNRTYRLASANVEIVEETEESKLKPTLDVLWPIINEIRKGITINGLCERLPLEPKHKIYRAMRYLADENELEQFGERRSTTYSLPGEGEFGHDEAVQAKAEDIKDKILEAVKTLKAARPLMLEQTLLFDRNVLNTALDDLVEDGRLKFFGERRGKMVALPHLTEEEIIDIRDGQISVMIGVDPFSARLARGDTHTIAVSQRFGVSPYIVRTFNQIATQTEVKRFLSYSEVRNWFLSEMKADVQHTN